MKKIISVIIALICCAVCAFACCACDNVSPYYNKTFTFTGEQKTDWNGKNFFDNYGKDLDKEVSQKQILEKHWDKIDFTQSDVTSASSVDDLIAKIDNAKTFAQIKDLSLSFGSKDDLKLTITLPTSFDNCGFGSEITMPFAETQAQLEKIKPSWYGEFIIDEDLGYRGLGIKETDGKALVVFFSYTSVSATLFIECVQAIDNSNETIGSYRTIDLRPKIADADGNSILDVAVNPVYTVTNNK